MSLLYNAAALSKGWKKYYIMHKNRRVATIREDGSCTVYYPSFMPYNLWLEKAGENDMDTRLNNLTMRITLDALPTCIGWKAKAKI